MEGNVLGEPCTLVSIWALLFLLTGTQHSLEIPSTAQTEAIICCLMIALEWPDFRISI